jgi:hypothetical protein
MIWLSWRQLRTQAFVVFGMLAVLGVILIITGLRLRHAYDVSGIASCSAVGDCDTVINAFTSQYSWMQTLLGSILLVLLPAALGVFWGAPLIARELDSGTFRLAWTQSITRNRWLAAKVLVVGSATVAATALLSWLTTWWFTPLDRVAGGKFDPSSFQVRDVAPIGYAIFAFALGLTLGLLIRRTLPAMASTLVGFIAARLAVTQWVRPRFRTPLHVSGPLAEPPAGPGHAVVMPPLMHQGDWVVSSTLTDPSGHTVDGIRVPMNSACLTTRTCVQGYTQHLAIQPASRYWPFQWMEAGLFALAGALLIGFCFRWINDHPFRRATTPPAQTAVTPAPDALIHA